MPTRLDDRTEWLETDGRGGYAFGTVNGIRTRRYHGLLVVATRPPTGRVVLVNGFEAWVESAGCRTFITSHRYAPDVVHPDGVRTLVEFTPSPWPAWRYRLPDASEIEHDLLVPRGRSTVALCWRLHGGAPGARLVVRLLLSGRDHHTLHHENAAFDFDARPRGDALAWQPYAGGPTLVVSSNGGFTPDPTWYRDFLYVAERERGLDCREDLASPGEHAWELDRGAAVLLLDAATDACPDGANGAVLDRLAAIRSAERERRRPLSSRLDAAADAYVVRRGDGRTIVAGYPWFTDWGRDTFVALRGLCLATGRHDDAARILHAWAGTVSEGMLPNRFVDDDGTPEYNAVDASLWFVIAVHELLENTGATDVVSPETRRALLAAVDAILSGYHAGTRHGIRADDDGLLAAGEPGVQLTWMDAKVGDRVVTPRIGKPVEVQALWINALAAGATHDRRWRAPLEQARTAFGARFWNERRGCLYDVVDCDHEPGRVDATLRPNQILAVGGLPLTLLDPARAQRVVDLVERTLLTPFGLRTLGPQEPGYRTHYEGDLVARDDAYHQGTVWPWLMGPFVEAWVRVRGDAPDVRAAARTRFLEPLFGHLDEFGVGHVAEIFDAEPPHRPRGCPMQAWSVGELLRLDRRVLAAADAPDG